MVPRKENLGSSVTPCIYSRNSRQARRLPLERTPQCVLNTCPFTLNLGFGQHKKLRVGVSKKYHDYKFGKKKIQRVHCIKTRTISSAKKNELKPGDKAKGRMACPFNVIQKHYLTSTLKDLVFWKNLTFFHCAIIKGSCFMKLWLFLLYKR